MSDDASKWTALLLAGQRPEGDPLAARFGQHYKALIPVAGKSMLLRVADTLLSCTRIARIVILAQEPARLLTGDCAALANDPRVSLAVSDHRIAASIAGI
ncbi:MAG: NTP transferase domain-containing protein, partial [Novosphingobium sp.]|nr:NTP transferase domain-containing protein [Novosphingobium sp.]